MKSFDDDYPLAALRRALSDTVVAITVAVLISFATGAAVEVVAQWDWPSNREDKLALLFLWIIHWGVAGVTLVGLPFMLIQVWALYRLLMTETDPVAPILTIVINQAVVSTISTIFLAGGGTEQRRAAAAGVSLILLAVFALHADHKRRRTTALGE